LNKDIYEKECQSYPGFITVFRKGADNYNNKADQLEYENYRHVVHKWHYRITKAFVACLEHGYYVQIRNALIVMTKLLNSYPKIVQFGQAIERRVDKLRQEEKDKRPDLQAVAQGYLGMLRQRHSSWVSESDFHLKDASKAAAAAKASAAPASSVVVATAAAASTNGDVKKNGSSAAASADNAKKVAGVKATPVKVVAGSDKRSSTAGSDDRSAGATRSDSDSNRSSSVKGDNDKSSTPTASSNGTKRASAATAASNSSSKDGGPRRSTTAAEDAQDVKRRKVDASGGAATKDDRYNQRPHKSDQTTRRQSKSPLDSPSHHKQSNSKHHTNDNDVEIVASSTKSRPSLPVARTDSSVNNRNSHRNERNSTGSKYRK